MNGPLKLSESAAKSRQTVHQDLRIYPAYCHSVSPTANTWARLSAQDVHNLATVPSFEGQNIFFHLNHPIRYVRIVGIIVSYEEIYGKIIMQVDDGSGATLSIVYTKPAAPKLTLPLDPPELAVNPDLRKSENQAHNVTTQNPVPSLIPQPLEIGTLIKAKGTVSTFRSQMQLLLKRISVLHSTSEEIAAWAEWTEFHTSVLSKPWVVDADTEARLKAEAELDLERDAQRERRRKEHAVRLERKAKKEREKQRRQEERREERRAAMREKEEQKAKQEERERKLQLETEWLERGEEKERRELKRELQRGQDRERKELKREQDKERRELKREQEKERREFKKQLRRESRKTRETE